jgi:hypothetical protein
MKLGARRLQPDVCRGLQSAPDEHLEWKGQRLAFALADGWGVVEELAREAHPRGFAGWSVVTAATDYQSVGAVQDYASGVFEVVTAGVDHGEI